MRFRKITLIGVILVVGVYYNAVTGLFLHTETLNFLLSHV